MSWPGLVIFDCDGVLVDSELLACRNVSECLSELGIKMSVRDVIDRFAGVSAKTRMADLKEHFNDAIPFNFSEILSDRLNRLFEAELRPIDGCEDALRDTPYPKCVASSSTPERLHHSLGLTGMLPYFDGNLFSSTMVPNGKPAPDLYLFAASKMDCEPRRCVVVEDSIAGVQGAVAAGMRCVGFTGGSHCEPGHAQRLFAAGASTVIVHMKELPPLLHGDGVEGNF